MEHRFEDDFEKGLTAIYDFVEREGHARVRQGYKENGYSLGSWVSPQRQNYRNGFKLQDNIKLLEAVPGWSWDVLKSNFQSNH